LVRLHRIDENSAGEVAELLAYFRSLQRDLDLSVVLVHHTRKNAAAGTAAGQGLRGSSDIHAFGDSNLYLRRSREHLVLASEHRAAPASVPVCLELVATNAETIHLEVVADIGESSRAELRNGSTKLTTDCKQRGLEERLLHLLGPGATVTRARLRDCLGVKNERLGEALESLERAGRICRTPAGWQRRD
jgi:AAA domain